MFWKVPRRMSKITLVAGDYIVIYPELLIVEHKI